MNYLQFICNRLLPNKKMTAISNTIELNDNCLGEENGDQVERN